MPDLERIARAVRSLSDDIGRQVLSGKPQPSANVPQLAIDAQAGGPAKDSAELGARINDKLNDVHEYARVVHGGDGEYPITGFVSVPESKKSKPFGPSDATIRRTTLEDELKRIYGQHATAVMDNIVKNQSPGTLGAYYPQPGGAAGNLSRRMFVVSMDKNHPPNASRSGAQEHVGYVTVNPTQAADAGSTMGAVLDHELGHAVAPSRDHSHLHKLKFDEFFDDLMRSSPGEMASRAKSDPNFPAVLKKAFDHTNYTATKAEMLANLAHMMRLEYGLTGKPIITPEDRIRAVLQWMGATPRVNPDPGSKWMQIHGQDPILQHGPDAGNPATGYETMRQKMRSILKPLPGKSRPEVIKAMGFLGSTEEPKGDEVYG